MENLDRIMTGIASGLVVLSASVAGAQDWPQWRGPNRDGKATGFSAPTTWPKELTQKWKVTVGLGDATPAVVGNKLYVFVRPGLFLMLMFATNNTGNLTFIEKRDIQHGLDSQWLKIYI